MKVDCPLPLREYLKLREQHLEQQLSQMRGMVAALEAELRDMETANSAIDSKES